MAFLEILARDLEGPRSRAAAHHARQERLARLRAVERQRLASERRVAEADRRAEVETKERRIEAELRRSAALDAIRPRWRTIANEISEETGISVAAMLGPSRPLPVARARQALMYRLWFELEWSLIRIGQKLNRDHTTVLHGVKAHAKRHGLPLAHRPRNAMTGLHEVRA